jgi:cysteine desulfurase
VAAVATSVVDTTVVQQAVREAAAALGMSHIILPVDANGRIQPSALERLESPTVLVTALGNQEIGVVQTPLQHWAQDTGSVVVLDARCAFGWIDLPEHWDFLVLDPRAWGAPAGSAITVARADSPPPIPFDNVPAAVTGVLCGQLWAQQAPDARDSVRRQVEMLRERLSRLTGVELHGGGPDDLPHILSISVLYVDAEAVQTQLDALGFAVGSGSACASRSGEPSHVLAAIGGLTSGNLRIGLPPGLADRTIEEFADAVIDVVTAERSRMGTDDL